MSIDITRIERDEQERWDDLVERSPHATLFHRHEFLDTLADHSGTELHLLAGHKGQEPVGIFPLFEAAVGPLDIIFSPPPDMGLFQLGPAMLNFEKLSPRKQERRNRRFVDGCLGWLSATVDPAYVHARSQDGYADLRPFLWNNFSVTPRYSYVVDLDADEDDLLTRFSRSPRRNISDARESDCIVEIDGKGAIDTILDQVRRRYEEQGERYPIDADYVRDLYDRLPEGRVRPHVCRTGDGRYVGGLITLVGDGVVYRWQGGVQPEVDVDVQVNDYIDWRIMQTALEEGMDRYDLAGGNTPRICDYKAKFGPDLRTFYVFERGGPFVRAAKAAYNHPTVQTITSGRLESVARSLSGVL